MAWKTSCSPGRSARSETDTNRITIGLTLRRTARKIRRLKGVVGGMCPSYSDSADPRFPDALPFRRRFGVEGGLLGFHKSDPRRCPLNSFCPLFVLSNSY